MQQTVEANKTLLVNGPASVKVVSGKTSVFGCPIKPAAKTVVRDGKRLPFFVLEKSVFEVSLGVNATLLEAEGDTAPSSWGKVAQAIAEVEKRPAAVLIMGQTDSGKSSLCTYLLNKLCKGNRRVAVLDGDLGQSDIGPSATIAYAVTAKPQTELYNLKLENGYFVGVTSPLAATTRTLEAFSAVMAEISGQKVDFVLINTGGWVTGEAAVNYKAALFNTTKPDVIVGIQIEKELEELIAKRTAPTYIIEPSTALTPRSTEKRKVLREMTYARYLKHAKIQCYPISQLTVEPKKAIPQKQEPKKGLLVGLYGRNKQFLGIGVLRAINPERRVLKVQTAIVTKPQRLVIGKVEINQKLQEV